MSTSAFFSPTPFVFERGAAKSVGQRFKAMGSTKILLVCDKGIAASGLAARITGYLKDADLEVIVYDGVQADPPDWSAEESGKLGVDNNVDGFLGLGGGSSIDTAKASAVLQAGGFPLSKHYMSPGLPPTPLPVPMKPLIVIPTTAGTGSEVSPGGIITESATGAKQSVNCPTTLALVDPEMSIGLPPAITAMTGFDALCHAIESLTSKEPNAAARVLGMEAVRLVATNLEEAVVNGANMEAREGMQLAASLAIMSIIGPFCHIPHDIGMAIGSKLHIPHGAACAYNLAESMRYIGPSIPKQMKDVAVAMLQDVPVNAMPEEITDIVVKAILDLAKRAKMPKITDYVKTKEEYLGKADFIFEIMPFVFSPIPVTKEALVEILSKSYDNAS